MPTPPVLRSIRLRNYKGFSDHTINLRVGANILVGANNAGKSTALGALRLVASMLPTARRINPTRAGVFNGATLRGWPVTAAALEASAFALENIRYDFRPNETSIEVSATSRAKCVICWEDQYDLDTDVQAMFFVLPPAGSYSSSRDVARNLIPDIGILPTFAPIEDREPWVTDETVRRNLTSRRASRYIRNSLLRLGPDQWNSFREFVLSRTPEMLDLAVEQASGTADNDIDLFFTEPETRHLREVVWAGDGVQIWLQILYHLWRQSEAPVILLDEPDIFLHPDLQRRLARTVFPRHRQTIVATHSTEILAEAEIGSAIWIDRGRRSAERPRSDGAISLLGRRLGSGFELGVARALRSRSVLFVEGDDAPVLAQMAKSMGFDSLSRAEAYATVPLGGFSRRDLASAFSETLAALGGEVKTAVVLDSDLRSEAAIEMETKALKRSGALVHVWRRREIENYLLQPNAIAGASGVGLEEASEVLKGLLEQFKDEALITLNSARLAEQAQGIDRNLSHKTLLEKASRDFELTWSSLEGQLSVVDPKAVIRALNQDLRARGHAPVNPHSLARNMSVDHTPREVRDFFEALERLVARS